MGPAAPRSCRTRRARRCDEGRTQWVRAVADELAAPRPSDDPADLAAVARAGAGQRDRVPLVAEGRALGVITLARRPRAARPFTAADVEVAEQLALQVSLVIAKAQRYELDVRTSHTLQANLLPPAPPDVPGICDRRCGTWRRPTGWRSAATSTTSSPLPGEHVALAVGDVVGHDITAAATMGQLTQRLPGAAGGPARRRAR